MSSNLPEMPEGATLMALMLVLSASHDFGNNIRAAKMLDLIAETRRALDGDRPTRERPPH